MFIDFIREVINTDNPLNGDIDEIRWSVFKIDNYVLWGIGCDNSKLSTLSRDKVGTPVRGFFGIISKLNIGEKLVLPYDLRYFEKIYSEIINPVWESREERVLNNIDPTIFPDDIHDIACIDSNNERLLNEKANYCVVYPSNTDIKLLAGSALSYSKINFVSGLNRAKHAEESHFMNAISKDCEKKQVFNLAIEIPDPIAIDDSEEKIPKSILDRVVKTIHWIAQQFNLHINDVIEAIKQHLKQDERKKEKEEQHNFRENGSDSRTFVPTPSSKDDIKLHEEYNAGKEKKKTISGSNDLNNRVQVIYEDPLRKINKFREEYNAKGNKENSIVAPLDKSKTNSESIEQIEDSTNEIEEIKLFKSKK
jgi:hypothetical protein